MKDLIRALNIFMKYANPLFPFYCEHDTLYITDEIDASIMAAVDIRTLEGLGFHVDDDGYFYSYKYGSC